MEFTSIKELNEHQLKQVIDWLKEHNMVYNEKRLLQDFSDCVNVAKILKTIHPKHVEMHNYPPRSNTDLKLNNWQTLNFKVLSKIGLSQSPKKLEKLARGDQRAVESLLYNILRHERVDRLKRATIKEQERNDLEAEGDIMKININKRIGDAVIQVPQKMILYSSYAEALKRRESLDNAINDVKQSIEQLEALLDLKNKCIEDLRGQLSMHTTVSQAKINDDDAANVVEEKVDNSSSAANENAGDEDSVDEPVSAKSDELKKKGFATLTDQQKRDAVKFIKAAFAEVTTSVTGHSSSSSSVSSLSLFSNTSKHST